MKSIHLIPSILIIAFFCPKLNAQSRCSQFYPFEMGTTSQITTYNKKGKVAAITDYIVEENTEDSASMKSKLNDKNGELISETTYDIKCFGDGISIDFKSMMSPQLVEQFRDMDTEVTGTHLVLPNSLEIGQTLQDADLHIRANMGGIYMNMEIGITNRKVIAEETITTPAGTFECYVIEYDIGFKMGMHKKGRAKQWIAKNVGMVKQEDYNKRGKVTSSSLLTAFNTVSE